jgi:hypothetical protein
MQLEMCSCVSAADRRRGKRVRRVRIIHTIFGLCIINGLVYPRKTGVFFRRFVMNYRESFPRIESGFLLTSERGKHSIINKNSRVIWPPDFAGQNSGDTLTPHKN